MDGNKIIEKCVKMVTRIRLSETVDIKPLFLEYSRFPAEITWQSTDTQAESAVTAWKK